jgi:hypothetical protein
MGEETQFILENTDDLILVKKKLYIPIDEGR